MNASRRFADVKAMRVILAVVTLACLLALAACSPTPTDAPGAADVPGATDAAGPTSPAVPALADKELNLFAWSEYVPQAVLDRFAEQYGVQVNYDTYASNEELLAKLRAGGSRYDVIVPSDYLVTLLREQDMLLPLDKAQLPNMVNLDPSYLGLEFDPGNDHSVPYQWGTTGIAVNTANVDPPIATFADLWRPDLKERLVVLDDQREMLGIALVQLGFDRNSTDPEQLAAARDKLMALKPNIKAFDSDSPKTLLLSGEVDAGVVYNGEAALSERENPFIRYVLPEDGCGLWFDNLAIPKSAPHPAAAHAFIDFMLEPENSALITRDFPYSNPNQAGLDFVRERWPELWQAYEASPATNPPPEIIARCQTIEDVGDALPLYGDMWTAVKAGE